MRLRAHGLGCSRPPPALACAGWWVPIRRSTRVARGPAQTSRRYVWDWAALIASVAGRPLDAWTRSGAAGHSSATNSFWWAARSVDHSASTRRSNAFTCRDETERKSTESTESRESTERERERERETEREKRGRNKTSNNEYIMKSGEQKNLIFSPPAFSNKTQSTNFFHT